MGPPTAVSSAARAASCAAMGRQRALGAARRGAATRGMQRRRSAPQHARNWSSAFISGAPRRRPKRWRMAPARGPGQPLRRAGATRAAVRASARPVVAHQHAAVHAVVGCCRTFGRGAPGCHVSAATTSTCGAREARYAAPARPARLIELVHSAAAAMLSRHDDLFLVFSACMRQAAAHNQRAVRSGCQLRAVLLRAAQAARPASQPAQLHASHRRFGELVAAACGPRALLPRASAFMTLPWSSTCVWLRAPALSLRCADRAPHRSFAALCV